MYDLRDLGFSKRRGKHLQIEPRQVEAMQINTVEAMEPRPKQTIIIVKHRLRFGLLRSEGAPFMQQRWDITLALTVTGL
jgi:hypothetical protein